MNTVAVGREFEMEVKEILKRHFDRVVYLGNKRKIFDFFCYKNSKKYKVECKHAKVGSCFTFFPRELEADIIFLKLKNRMFVFNKYNTDQMVTDMIVENEK